ncbi:MAG: hypothetical protein SVY53_00840, partial [Chloroflexota bacterium]|nr:hypothetical protein [Chloroflexota bacterium]
MRQTEKTGIFHMGLVPFGLFLVATGWTGFFAVALLKGGGALSFLAMMGAACMGAGLAYFVNLAANTHYTRDTDNEIVPDSQEARKQAMTEIAQQSLSSGIHPVDNVVPVNPQPITQATTMPPGLQETIDQTVSGKTMAAGVSQSQVPFTGVNQASNVAVNPMQTRQPATQQPVPQAAMNQALGGTAMAGGMQQSPPPATGVNQANNIAVDPMQTQQPATQQPVPQATMNQALGGTAMAGGMQQSPPPATGINQAVNVPVDPIQTQQPETSQPVSQAAMNQALGGTAMARGTQQSPASATGVNQADNMVATNPTQTPRPATPQPVSQAAMNQALGSTAMARGTQHPPASATGGNQ